MITELIYALILASLALFAVGGLSKPRNGFDLLLALMALCVFGCSATIAVLRSLDYLQANILIADRPFSWLVIILAVYSAWRAPAWAEALPERMRDWLAPIMRLKG